jgi:hypothetical protein
MQAILVMTALYSVDLGLIAAFEIVPRGEWRMTFSLLNTLIRK